MKFLIGILVIVSFLFGSIDLNTASEQKLKSLNGIGNVKAKAIVTYRQSNCFKTVDALMDVKGIGKKTLEKNREKIMVSECK